jgi:hypothetical protein
MGKPLDKRLARRFRAFKTAYCIFRLASFGKLAAGDCDGNAVGSHAVDLKNRIAEGATRRPKRRRDGDLCACI